MNHISVNLKSVEQSPPTVPFVDTQTREHIREPHSFRESLINQFCDHIDDERIGTGYPPAKRNVIAIKINQNPFLRESWQLEGFLKRCKGNKGGFSKLFFWAIKQK